MEARDTTSKTKMAKRRRKTSRALESENEWGKSVRKTMAEMLKWEILVGYNSITDVVFNPNLN